MTSMNKKDGTLNVSFITNLPSFLVQIESFFFTTPQVATLPGVKNRCFCTTQPTFT